MKTAQKEQNGSKDSREDAPKGRTMDELRKPSTMLPPTSDEFRIVSPGPHVPAGQTTHE